MIKNSDATKRATTVSSDSGWEMPATDLPVDEVVDEKVVAEPPLLPLPPLPPLPLPLLPLPPPVDVDTNGPNPTRPCSASHTVTYCFSSGLPNGHVGWPKLNCDAGLKIAAWQMSSRPG